MGIMLVPISQSIALIKENKTNRMCCHHHRHYALTLNTLHLPGSRDSQQSFSLPLPLVGIVVYLAGQSIPDHPDPGIQKRE